VGCREEVTASFSEEKEAKRLLLLGDLALPVSLPPISGSFLLLFFKKEGLASFRFESQT
jgi:hypothetical protein